MYQGNGEPIRFLDQIVLANPGSADWQRHFIDGLWICSRRRSASTAFTSTPMATRESQMTPTAIRSICVAPMSPSLQFVRASRPADLLSFNQVNGVPSAARLPGGPGFRYCEIWPPNDAWRHFEGLLDRSSGHAGMLSPERSRDSLIRGTIACYPPVWDSEAADAATDRGAALRTVVSTEAIVTCLGAAALIYGDKTAALCDPYYPKHARLDGA